MNQIRPIFRLAFIDGRPFPFLTISQHIHAGIEVLFKAVFELDASAFRIGGNGKVQEPLIHDLVVVLVLLALVEKVHL